MPSCCGCGDQHLARGGTGGAQQVLRITDAAAAAGREVAPDAVTPEILVRGGEFDRHLAPVAFQLLGDQHRQRGEHALAHLRPRDPDDDSVVRPDHDPSVDFGRASGARDIRPERDLEAKREPAAAAAATLARKLRRSSRRAQVMNADPSNRAGDSNGKTTISSQQFARGASRTCDSEKRRPFGCRSRSWHVRYAVRIP